MTASPRISVVIPVYNGRDFLADAIRSVLAQSMDSVEIIVVDDGSTDGSGDLARGFGAPIRLIRQENSGHVVARNVGLKACRGDYITSLDADDLYTPDKFALQVARLDRHPQIDIVIGQLSYLRLDGTESAGPRFTEYRDDDHLTLSFGGSLFRRTVFDRVGLLDETMRFGDDWDWFLRAREAGVPMLLHRHVVLRQRLHQSNMTRQQEEGIPFLFRMARKSLDRRRHSGLGDAESLPPLASFFEPDDDAPTPASV